MATRTVMTANIDAAPDHIHVHHYLTGEQYTIGSPFMPQPLSTLFVALSKATQDSTAVASSETARASLALAVEIAKDGAETQAFDATDPRWAAHIAAWHRGT